MAYNKTYIWKAKMFLEQKSDFFNIGVREPPPLHAIGSKKNGDRFPMETSVLVKFRQNRSNGAPDGWRKLSESRASERSKINFCFIKNLLKRIFFFFDQMNLKFFIKTDETNTSFLHFIHLVNGSKI